jgi:hypothetical protein
LKKNPANNFDYQHCCQKCENGMGPSLAPRLI